MSGYAETIERLMGELGRLPGIGARTAERLAFHLLKASDEEAFALADAIRDVKTRIHPCETCFNLTEDEQCGICADPQRDKSVICVVEQPKDLLALEATGSYRGVYHVLMGRIAPLDNVEAEDLTVEALEARVRAGLLPAELDDLRPALSPEDAWRMREEMERTFEPVEPVEPKDNTKC